MKAVFSVNVLLAVCAACATGDTFTSRTGEIVYHGYATQTITDGKTRVYTQEEGPIELNLAAFEVTPNALGRNNFVSVISISDAFLYELITQAIEEAIVEESNKGPLLIIIEIDSPGGRTDLAERICSTLINTRNCRTVAFIHGRPNGGAYSAAAAVALACDEIYMVPGSSIGAATQYIRTASGEIQDMRQAFGDSVGEKFQSVWRNYFASLAQRNNRPGAVARAMVDKEIEVVEVQRSGQTLFIEPREQQPGDRLVRVHCQKGEIITLTASEAVTCRIADGVVQTREELLLAMDITDAAIRTSNATHVAEDELERVINRFERLNSALDLKYRELDAKVRANALTRSAALRDFQEIIRNAQFLLRLKQSYPDVPVTEETLEAFLNQVRAEFQAIRAIR